MERNPDGPPSKDSGLFGLDDDAETARVVCLPVPFEATVSYRAGTKHGPDIIRRASHQVDLLDADVGDLRAHGIATLKASSEISSWSDAARPAAVRVIEAEVDGVSPDLEDISFVNAASARVEEVVFDETKKILEAKKIPFVVGGDHSVPLGAICAAVDAVPDMGILHVDAHADLRLAYEGFEQSHASIMRNVRLRRPDVSITQVGIRDFSPEEVAVIVDDKRITTYFDRDLRGARQSGTSALLFRTVVDTLPKHVWISFDIDGLDPTLCPGTGTPVPGGLSFDDAITLIATVVSSGRVIVGGDLAEVSPGHGVDPSVDTWDAVVGARLLYKMMGFALMSTGEQKAPALPRPPMP